MRRYLIVSGEFSHWGGMERANYELASYLAKDIEREVHLVAFAVEASLAERPNVIWHRVAKPLNADSLASPLLAWHGRRWARRLSAQGARVIVNGGNCCWGDINWVHACHAAWPRRDAQAPAGFRARAAWVKWSARRGEARALRSARLVLANSLRTKDALAKLPGVTEERIKVVYLGNDETMRPVTVAERQTARAALERSEDKPLALFVGALGYDRNKGFDLLFEAWVKLCRDPLWDVNLMALGNGAEVSYWRARAVAAGLSGRIQMKGFAKGIREALAAADILVSPTHYESYGLGVHEALCCGVPAFVTRTAGVAERYPQELQDLLLDAPPSSTDLVVRLRRWREDPEGYRRRVAGFGGQLRQRTWHDMAREIVELVDS